MSMNTWVKKLRGGNVNDNKDADNPDAADGKPQQEGEKDNNTTGDTASQTGGTLNPTSAPIPTTPATPTLDPDEIRRKRLERFGGGPARPPSTPTTTPTPPVSTPTSPSTVTSTPSTPPSTPIPTPTVTPPVSIQPRQPMEMEKATIPKSNPVTISKSPASTAPLKSPSSGFGVPSPTHLSPSPGGGSLGAQEQWENQVIERAFQVTLVHQSKESGNLFLKTLRQELEEESEELSQDAPLLAGALLERVLFERLSSGAASHRKNHIAYLIGCFYRVDTEIQKAPNKKSAQRMQVLERIVEFIIDYSVLVLLYPEDWPSNVRTGFQEEVATQFLACLEADPATSSAVPPEFLELLIKRLDESQVAQIFAPVFDELSFKMKAVSLLGSFVPLYRVFALLAKYKPIANLLPALPNWIPGHNTSGREIETNSFLGPFFRLTSCPSDPTVGNHYFAAPGQLSKTNVNVAQSSIRTALLTCQRLCHETVKAMLTAGGKPKEAVLDWIGAVLQHNAGRVRMHADRRKTSSEGFLLNLAAVMLNLCVPFLDATSPKMNMIDPTYLLTTARMGTLDDTKLAATSEEVREFLAKRETDGKPAGFVTECFFLTARCLHLGLLRTFLEFGAVIKAFISDRNAYENFAATRNNWPDHEIAQNEVLLARLQQRLDDVDRDRLCFEAQMFEPTLLERSMKFYLLLAVWLMRMADPEKKGLPLDPPPIELRTLPEHCVEDIADYFLFVSRYLPDRLEGVAGLDDLLSFLVLFLGSPTHVKNPYLRAKLVELMHCLTPTALGRNLGLYENNVIAQRHLARVLMAFYVDIEFSERTHNFYEKFNTRYDVASVMKHIWQIPEHRKAIERESNDEKLFLRFVNMLINDSIYLLDESLNKLAEIRGLEIAMSDRETWVQQDEETRGEREEHFARLERQVGTYMLLGNETINMMHYLTAEITTPFLRPELVDRLASMLNYFLQQLAGPKCTNLKVTKPDKYHFKPKVLLGHIVDMYSHFGSKAKELSWSFAEAVARDGRSYNEELFPRVIHILRRESIRPEMNIGKLEAFANMVKESADKVKTTEETLGEIPDDYLDPIMATLMTDPVILPTSGKTMDRAVIARHLLSDNKDPFNRAYLTVEMLKPNDALRAEIEAWLKSKGQEGAGGS